MVEPAGSFQDVITYRSTSCYLIDCGSKNLTYFTMGNHNRFISDFMKYWSLKKKKLYIFCISIPEAGSFETRKTADHLSESQLVTNFCN